MKLIFSFISAALFPALAMTAWYLFGQFEMFESTDPFIWVRTRGFFLITFFISSCYVVLLGAPAYLVLRHFNLIRWWSALLAGFILGAVPVAVFTWPLNYSGLKTSATIDGVETIINGVPTMAGWIQYIQGVSFFGVCGVVAALAFWLVAPNKSLKRVPSALDTI